MRVQVPQFIEIEDKIFGELTLKQFIFIAGGAGLSFVVYVFLDSIILSALPIILIMGSSLLLSFKKVHNRPLIYIVEAAFKYFMGNKLYIWKKESKVEPKIESSNDEAKKYAGIMVPKISDSKLSANDPQLMDKMVGRFEAFVAKIPNQEFRGNLQKGIAMIPQTARTGLVAQALQKLGNGFMASDSGPSGISDLAINKSEKFEPAQSSKTAAPVVAAVAPPVASLDKAAGSANRAPSSNTNLGQKIENAGFFIGLEKEPNDQLGNIIQSAMESQGTEETIFSQVTRRYRIVTPLLSRTP
jgi:hypothetical protein